jgi:hypothetical protein
MDIIHPTIRLDFILMSPAVLRSIQQSIDGKGCANATIVPQLFGGVEVTNYTDIMSDHYPVYAQWKDYSLPCQIDLY